MTEDEAKTKRCCGPDGCGKVIGADEVYDPKGDVLSWEQKRNCIGSACMAWREGERELDNDDSQELRIPEGETNPPFSNCPAGYRVASYSSGYYRAELNARVIEHGFCGLAGQP